MDNLTHTLTALAMSRAGLNRLYARPLLILITAANLPDVDVVSTLGGALTYIQYHRGLTHALPFMPVLALVPVLLGWAVTGSRARLGWAYLLSLIGIGSHLFLDWTNVYGIRLLLPFSGKWLHGDLNNIVDVWIWAVLLLAALGPLLGRLVSAEIGAKPSSGRGLAIFALVFLAMWDFGRYLMHQRAMEVLESRIYEGAAPLRVGAFPETLSPVHWTGWVETEHAAIRYQLNLLTPFDPASGTKFYKAEANPAVEAAKNTRTFETFLRFTLYPLWMSTPTDEPEGGTRVTLRDERLPFTATAVLDRSGRVVREEFHF